jgi:hypothetical protein
VLQGARANRRHFTLEVEDSRRDPRLCPGAGFLEADAYQVAAHQRDDARRMRPKRRVRLSRPGTDIREEGADLEQPDVRGVAQLRAGIVAALPLAGLRDRVRDIGAPMRGQDVRAPRDGRVLLGQEAPEVAQRDQFVTKRDVDLADTYLVRLQVERRDPSKGRGHVRHRDQFPDRASWPPAAPARAALRRAFENAQSAQRDIEHVLAPGAGRDLRHVLVGDLVERVVASRDQHTETDGDRFVLRAPAAPRDRSDLTP